jgi:hypothetical protein
MLRQHFRCFLLPTLLLVAPLALPEVDSPETLDNVRQDAMALIQSGQRLEAAQLLLETLGSIPRDRADLAYPSLGCVQLLLFNNEYLMAEEECIALYDQSLHEDTNEMHKLLAVLMRYMDDAGMTQEQAGECSIDLHKLTRCDHLAVRLGALFVMSSPYYFYDTTSAQWARDQIVKEFSGTHLAAEAQRLDLYRARTSGAAGLEEALNRPDYDGALRAHSVRMQADPVGHAISQAVARKIPNEKDAACVGALASLAQNSADWSEQYAALNILEGYHGTPFAPQVGEAAAQCIGSNTDPRSTFRARVIRMSVSRHLNDVDTLLEDAYAILAMEPIPVVPERNNYEELRNSVRDAATFLAEQGLLEPAQDLLTQLAARFPNTLLSAQMNEIVATLVPTSSDAPSR